MKQNTFFNIIPRYISTIFIHLIKDLDSAQVLSVRTVGYCIEEVNPRVNLIVKFIVRCEIVQQYTK